jgi:hypothetical protein
MTRTLVGIQHISSLQHACAYGPRFPEVSPKNKPPVVPQPPHSPHVSPAAFFLFLKLKVTLIRCLFKSVEKIQ